MADSPISALPPAAALSGTELVPVVQAGVTVGATAQQLAAVPGVLPQFTVAGLPAAGGWMAVLVYVSNGTANKRLAVSDGTNWRWPDGSVVS